MTRRWETAWGAGATKGFDALPKEAQERVLLAVGRFAMTGQGDVKPLRGAPGEYRLRVGDYRARFTLEGDTLVVLAVTQRGSAYR